MIQDGTTRDPAIDARHEGILASISPSVLEGRVRSTSDGLEFDWHSPDGRVTTQRRPDAPGNGPKYLWPTGAVLPLGVPQGMSGRVADPKVPLVIVEGTKQHLAAASVALEESDRDHRVAVVGISGCWGWRQDSGPIGDLRDVPLEGREVFLAFDADMNENRQVYEAAQALGEYLKVERGASTVRFVRMPGRKDGFDDVLARADDPVAVFRRLLAQASTKMGRKPAARAGFASPFFDNSGRYLVRDHYNAIADDFDLAVTPDMTIAVFADGFYHNGESREFYKIVADTLGNDYRQHHRDNLNELALDLLVTGGQSIPARPDKLLINCRNGLLDPLTLELHPHDPEYRTLWQLNVEWDPTAECPVYEQWVESVIPGRVLELEDAVCVMLDPTRTPTRAVFMFGPSRSGKSTFGRLLVAIVGKEATSAVSLHQLATDRFAAANLLGKRLNVAMDLSADEVKDLSTFKMILGDDPIQANRKYGAQFTMENQALVVFSANEIPPVSETSKAYLARMMPFEFPQSFLGAEDPSIEGAMMDELPGIFRRLVLALNARLRRGNRYLEIDHEDVEKFRLASNKTAQFLAERTRPDEEGTERPNVYASYKTWCEQNGGHALGRNRFFAAVRSEGVEEFKPRGGSWRMKLALVDPERGDHGPVSAESVGSSTVSADSTYPALGAGGNITISPRAPRPGLLRTAESFQNCWALPFDLETDSADLLHSVRDGFVRIAHSTEGSGTAHILEALESGQAIAAHNGFSFDFHALGIDILEAGDRGMLIDTMVLGILDHPPIGRRNAGQVLKDYSAAALARRYGIPGKTGDIKKMAKEHGGFDKIPLDDPDYNAYCRADAVIVAGVLERIPFDDYAAREMRVMSRLAGPITGTGFRVDVPLLERRVAEGEARRAHMRSKLEALGLPEGGKAPQSTKAGKEAILAAFTDLGVEVPRTEKGSPALGKDGIGELDLTGDAAALRDAVLELNGVRTIYQTIRDNVTGDRVHPTVQPLQASGRFSVRDPGLTVVGKRGGRHVERAVFLPDPGDVLLAVDLDQIDARAVAVHSQDPAYLELFEPGRDSHQEVADLLGLGREQAKAIAHGWNYGEGIRALVRNTGLPREVVEQFDRGMRERFPRLVEWRSEVYELGKAGALLDNGFGRKLRVDPSFSFTQAPAYMGQSTARDLMAEGVLRLPLEIARMIRAFVHDEIVLSVPADRADEVAHEVLKALTFEWAPEGASRPVKITAGVSRPGNRWSGCYEKESK